MVRIELPIEEAEALADAAQRGYTFWGIHHEDDIHLWAVAAEAKVRKAIRELRGAND